MLGSCPIMAFVATKDAVRAKAFYQDVLGLKFVADDGYALVFDANGIVLRVAKAKELTPAPYTVLGWKVADIAAAMKDLTGRGVTFEQFPWMKGDELGVFTFQGGTRVAWFKDPDGNMLSLTQFP
jgi:catechol 2,3-dioxygenase-like lactoylglutathione lyase family enzyme